MKAQEHWGVRWYDSNEDTCTAHVEFSIEKDAENFRRFVNRRFGGTAYRRGCMVIVRPAKPSIIRGLVAAFGKLGDISFTSIHNYPV